MRPRILKLGTRRSALARAQSAAVARALRQAHPDIAVELVGIDTRGDRIQDRPLSAVEGKEFFTAEIDRALLRGAVDFTVHSCKDLSLERDPGLRLAAVPRRQWPADIALFAPDVPGRLAAAAPPGEGAGLLIGSSSPRRASFVPPLLGRLLPRAPAAAAPLPLRMADLRGNVDTRLRRLHEPQGAARRLDGIVLAFAGLARLWADEDGRALLARWYAGLPRMLLPLSACPAAPAQGALGIECRAGDEDTAALLRAIDDAPTRRAIERERALLAERGGGCHQRLGATQIEVPELGSLFYVREGEAAPQLHWTPETALEAPAAPVRAWDGSRAEPAAVEPDAGGTAHCRRRLPESEAVFIAHSHALPAGAAAWLRPGTHVYAPGVSSWQGLAAQGVWVEGCADGLGIARLEPLLREPVLQLPAPERFTVLTHAGALEGWAGGQAIATYRVAGGPEAVQRGGPPPGTTHCYWHSSAQFDRWQHTCPATSHHATGPGKSFEHLRRARVQNLRMFPSPAQWRAWLGL